MSPNKIIKTLKRGHFVIAIVIVVALLLIEGLFLYRYFYSAITESRVLKELKQRAALEELQLDKFEKLIEFSAKKQQERPIDWDALRDPFVKR
jgi:hypothetical protein